MDNKTLVLAVLCLAAGGAAAHAVRQPMADRFLQQVAAVMAMSDEAEPAELDDMAPPAADSAEPEPL